MSNFNACSTDDINYVKHGTCLNACNMRAIGWLDEQRSFYLVYWQRYAVRFSTQGELLEEALPVPMLLPVSGGGEGEAWNFSRHLAFSVSYCSWFITPATNLESRSIATCIRPFVSVRSLLGSSVR